ncbi:MAG: hypothetical protein A2046_04770 [Bacteroidetes bacterium GWA2_30_7]|nr:MAG: hypothetical protein A2046_04770 [Bacteroidetes bacterium GWA2_30_7]
MVLLLHYNRPLKISSKFYKPEFKLLLKTGIPLFSMIYLQSLTSTFSRVVLLSVTGVIAVGYYSPALAIITAMNLFPTIVAQYMYPQMSYEVGKSNDKNKLWTWVWKSSFYIGLFLLPMAIIGCIIIPYFIESFFVKYTSAIFASKLAFFSGVFSGSIIGLNVLYSLKAWKSIFFVTLFKLTLYGVLLNYFARVMNSIDGVATGLLVSDIIFFIFGIGICYYELKLKNKSKIIA